MSTLTVFITLSVNSKHDKLSHHVCRECSGGSVDKGPGSEGKRLHGEIKCVLRLPAKFGGLGMTVGAVVLSSRVGEYSWSERGGT